ncbi:hypothetical protein CGCTS75_v007379 [Colletotrichum tropicale]|nr:hypothetical protein CGCTS75_v007379 [Colletotrichum tropicale]
MASISLAGTFFAGHGYDSWLLLLLAAIFLVGGSQLRGNSQDPREPPALKPKIPVVGHIIGLLGLRQYYYRQLGV